MGIQVAIAGGIKSGRTQLFNLLVGRGFQKIVRKKDNNVGIAQAASDPNSPVGVTYIDGDIGPRSLNKSFFRAPVIIYCIDLNFYDEKKIRKEFNDFITYLNFRCPEDGELFDDLELFLVGTKSDCMENPSKLEALKKILAQIAEENKCRNFITSSFSPHDKGIEELRKAVNEAAVEFTLIQDKKETPLVLRNLKKGSSLYPLFKSLLDLIEKLPEAKQNIILKQIRELIDSLQDSQKTEQGKEEAIDKFYTSCVANLKSHNAFTKVLLAILVILAAIVLLGGLGFVAGQLLGFWATGFDFLASLAAVFVEVTKEAIATLSILFLVPTVAFGIGALTMHRLVKHDEVTNCIALKIEAIRNQAKKSYLESDDPKEGEFQLVN